MKLEERIIALAQAVGADVKALTLKQGDLTNLSTTQKSSLVLAINELYSLVTSATSIDDAAGDGILNKTWSAKKIFDTIEAAKTAVKNELLGGASAAFDTLQELQQALNSDANFASTVATELANRVRVDAAQTFSVAEKLQACQNLGIGNPDYNFVADYNTAKA